MRKFGIGQAVRRVEDSRFLTGTGNYVADLILPRQCYGALVLSPHAHARIVSVDVSAARSAPGVLAVLTGADAVSEGLGGIPPYFMPDFWGGPKGHATVRPLLATDRVRCIGERVAYVVAETEHEARDAAELVQVDYDVLPAVIDVEEAARDGAPLIWEDCPDRNVGATIRLGDEGLAQAAFARAQHIVSLRLENNRITANAMEPRCVIGSYSAADGRYTLYTTSQNPHGTRTALAKSIFNVPETKVRVVAPDVGGGFGMKSAMYPDDALAVWGARRVGRPVKWTATRSESLLLDSHARDQIVYGDLALDAEGRILAIRARAYHALGAYWWAAITSPLMCSMILVPSVYKVDVVDLQTQAVFTNTATTSVYRGAGRPEAIYLIERLMDKAAYQLGIDQVEIRKRNLIDSSAFPYRTPTNQIYDSGEFAGIMKRCLEIADWDGFAARRAVSAANGRLRGRAVTPYIELAGIFNDRMELRFDPSGQLTIIAGTHSHGQGHETAFAQLVSEWLGVPFEAIQYIQGDTAQVAFGRGTFAARSSMIGASALRAASDTIIAKGKDMAGALMEVAPADLDFKDGHFTIIGTDRSMSITDVAKAFFIPSGPALKLGIGLDAAATYGGFPGGAPNYPNGCQVCEVEVDPETGCVEISRFAAVDDLGLIINPMICEGQIQGGIAQGLGQALLEGVSYDPEGQLVTGSFQDYAMPRASHVPEIVSELAEIPAKTNPLGIKGIGESGTIGAPPTIVNAVLDALRVVGVEHIDMPLSPARVWGAIQAARTNTALSAG